MKKSPYKKIFIAEVAEELKGFLECCRSTGINPSEFLVVALQPDVKMLCKENGMHYIDTLPFFNNDSHECVLKKSHRLTTLIFENLSFDVKPSVNKVFIDTFIFYSRFYINNFLWIIEVLKGIKKEYGDREIEIFVYRQNKVQGMVSQANPNMAKHDRFVDSLAEKYCRANGLKVHVVSDEKTSGTAVPKAGTRGGLIKNILEHLARTIFKRKLKKISRFSSVFITVPSYNLDRVCRDIQAEFPGVLTVTNLQGAISTGGYLRLFVKESLKMLTGKSADSQPASVPVSIFKPKESSGRQTGLEKIKGSYEEFASEYKGQFVYENCSFWEEFNKKVEGDLLDSTADLLDAAVGQERFLKYLKTKLLISPVSTTEFQSWAEVARLLDIPAILTPQKMLVAPSDEIAGIEERYIGRAQVTDTFANVAVQSPLVAEYLEWARYKGNRIETGNLIFARINGKKRKEKREAFYKEIGGIKKTIVWAPSMKTRKSRRFYVIETIDELTAAMEEVFDIVAQMEDVHLVFRIHPGDAITKDEIYALLQVPSNVSVSDSGTFEDVLAVGDLMISFSSTAIQESLINHTPVLLYDKWKRYNHLDAQKVGHSGPTEISSVYYINEKENLESGIRWILEKQAGTDVPPEIFKDYIFMEDKFSNFIDFVDKCLNV